MVDNSIAKKLYLILAKKFPHIKVKLIDVPEGDPIEPLLTQGIIPDIIFGGSYTAIEEAGLAEELAPYKKKFGYDDKKIKPSVNESIELKSGGNQVPFSVNLPVIYYNKDIFDKFSVPYPTEVQSWDQILDTAKQLTRADAGVNYIGIDLQPARLASGLSLDIIDPATNRAAVTHPNFGDALGTSIEINVHTLTLSKASKHKDEAYQVIEYMLSEEVQRIITRNGRVSVLDLPELEKEYGADIEVLKGKTIENIFKTEPRQTHKPNIYESKITKYINDAAKDVAIGGVDINTALRTAKEKIDKDLETLETTKS
ncbi:extracellular solute-binding protein [Paenibacillus sp. MCAF20]